MVRFGKRSASTPGDDWILTPAEILEIKYGLVHNTNTGVGGGYERSSANKTLRLSVEPAGAAAYEATLKVDRDGPSLPTATGTRVQVLVDPSGPQRLALPADPTFTLPGGQTYQPTQGLAGAIAEATRRGDAKEVMRLSAELQQQTKDAQVAATAPAPSGDDPLDRLEKLGKLRDSGVVSEQEFETEKAKILGGV